MTARCASVPTSRGCACSCSPSRCRAVPASTSPTTSIADDATRLVSLLVDERVALLHASAAVWRSALPGLRGRQVDLVAMVDVAELDANLAAGLLGEGCRVLSVFRPRQLGMPLAAALVRDARDCRVFGRPLLDGAAVPVDAQGQALPATVAGELAVTIAGRTERSGVLARWRSDGQLQYLGGSGATAPVEVRRMPRRAAAAGASALTPTQQALVETWQEVLGLQDVSPQDNFFELGGTSLAAMHAAQRLEQRLGGRRVSPRRYVFETLEQLAAAFDAEDPSLSTAETPEPPRPANRRWRSDRCSA